MSRRLFFIRNGNWVGEFPHDPQVGFVTNRRGIRRKLCTELELVGLSDAVRTQRLITLYNATAADLRQGQFKEEREKKRHRLQRKKQTMKQAGVRWLAEIEQGHSRLTWLEYRNTLNAYIESVGDHPISEFDRDRNLDFFHALQKRPSPRGGVISKATQNKHMRHLQAFLNWAFDQEILDRRFNLKRAVNPKKDMDTLNQNDLVRIRDRLEQALEQAGPEDLERPRNLYRAFKLASNTLLRLGAIWSLKLCQIDLKNREIRIQDNEELGWSNKKFKWPIKPINDSLFEFLEADLASRPAEHRYFLDNGKGQPWYRQRSDLSRAMKTVFVDAGYPDIKPFHHGFRATMITYLLTEGNDPYAVQQLADHESINTTLLYLNRRKIGQEKAANALSL